MTEDEKHTIVVIILVNALMLLAAYLSDIDTIPVIG